MAAVDPPETALVAQLLRRRPPAATLAWAAAASGPGSRVVAVRPLPSAWLANHALEVADAAGAVHRLVLRRWARPGWDEEDPDFTAAREAAILELLAPTPVPAPAVVAADPDATVCDVPALLLAMLPGDPPDLGGDLGPLVEGLAAALPPIHAVIVPSTGQGTGWFPATAGSTTRDAGPAGLVGAARAVAAGLRGGGRAAARRPGLPPPPRLPPGQHALGRRPAGGGGRLDRRVVGSPSVDLGHMRVNLAAELGLAVAERFLAAHRALTGADHHPWWDVASAVDVASEAPAAWRGAEDLVAAALACLGGEPGPGGG